MPLPMVPAPTTPTFRIRMLLLPDARVPARVERTRPAARIHVAATFSREVARRKGARLEGEHQRIQRDGSAARIRGDLTIRGITKPVVLEGIPDSYPPVTPPDTMNAMTSALSAARGATAAAGTTSMLPAKLYDCGR